MLAIIAPDQQLGEQRVVEHRDLAAAIDAGVVPHPRALRKTDALDASDRGQKAGRRILGQDASLHRPATPRRRGVAERERLPGRDAQLLGHQIEAGHHLGHRVLHLEPSVHLEKVESPGLVEQELHRAGIAIADLACDAARCLAERRAGLGIERRRGSLLEQLLVPPLDRAVALAEEHHALVIRQDLGFDVARALQVALGVEAIIAERAARLAARQPPRGLELRIAAHHAHALAAAARGRLEHQRKAGLTGEGAGRRDARQRARRRRHHGHAGPLRRLARGELVAETLDRLGRGTDEHHSGLRAGAGERRVLGEEAVARMNRIRPHAARGLEHTSGVEIALARGSGTDRPRLVRHQHVKRGTIRLTEDRDRGDAELAQGADHAHRDLAPVGDQHAPDRLRAHAPSSSTTQAIAIPPSWERVRCERVQPIVWKRSSAAPLKRSSGTRPPGWSTSMSFQPTPWLMPVPSAFEVASLAANRAARWGSGSRCVLQYARSPSVNRRFSIRSPKRSSDDASRDTWITSTPIPRTGIAPRG